VEGTVAASGLEGLRVTAPGMEILLPGSGAPGMRVAIAIRPERLRVTRHGGPDGAPNQARGTLRDVAYRGEAFIFHVALEGGGELRVSQPNLRPLAERPAAPGEAVTVTWDRDAPVVLRG
jgi:putrescine transport system ATP-binding protein